MSIKIAGIRSCTTVDCRLRIAILLSKGQEERKTERKEPKKNESVRISQQRRKDKEHVPPVLPEQKAKLRPPPALADRLHARKKEARRRGAVSQRGRKRGLRVFARMIATPHTRNGRVSGGNEILRPRLFGEAKSRAKLTSLLLSPGTRTQQQQQRGRGMQSRVFIFLTFLLLNVKH